MELFTKIPQLLVQFILVTVFSLLIGLSQRRIHLTRLENDRTFGTDRTFTFIGILGFILYVLDPLNHALFLGGGAALLIIISIFYFFHIREYKDFGATTIFIALITYCLGPLIITQPIWMVLMIVVVVLIFTELKETFSNMTEKFNRDEFITLAKFLIIAGVILPVVPDEPIVKGFNLTPYKIWLAVVVISSISYLSYLMKKFVFRNAGIVLSGILGGLYSSTATTIILARKSRQEPRHIRQYMAAIIIATAMMYLRILVLVLIFNDSLFVLVWPWFLGLFLITAGTGALVLYFRNHPSGPPDPNLTAEKNPLEFRTALIFTALFVAFSVITHEVLKRYGTPGLNLLSFMVGITDIDPFLINLFQGKFEVPVQTIAIASFQAIISNNTLKMFYGCFFGGKPAARYLVSGFLLIIALTILPVLFI
ncbi:MAG TPA: DUF4010 domain-containing protein [Bacteroidales bacterium]|nr:DUF4010 domain-containing protein [Bacteroidales bacterium]